MTDDRSIHGTVRIEAAATHVPRDMFERILDLELSDLRTTLIAEYELLSPTGSEQR